MSARTKPLLVVQPVAAEVATVVEHYALPAPKGTCRMIAADDAESLIGLLRTEAKVL